MHQTNVLSCICFIKIMTCNHEIMCDFNDKLWTLKKECIFKKTIFSFIFNIFSFVNFKGYVIETKSKNWYAVISDYMIEIYLTISIYNSEYILFKWLCKSHIS